METMHADATEGGPEGPSESVWNDQEAMQAFARKFSELIIGHRGALTPEASTQIDLRSDEERGKILAALVAELMPAEVEPAVWVKWLTGGETPFTAKRLKKPLRLPHGTGKAVARGSASLRPYRDRVEKARAELAYAEEALAHQEAMDKSLLDWVVTDHLLKLVMPIFAMGPAWVLMRAVSGFMSDEDADYQTRMLDGRTKERAIVELREKKQRESDELMEALDLWAGNTSFEKNLREALKKVVADFEPKRAEWISKGRRRRSRADILESVHPEAQQDRDEVLGGLKRRA